MGVHRVQGDPVHLITRLHHSQLITSLDFLDTVPELAEWYQGLTFTRNPFVLAVRPRIPVWRPPKAVLIVPDVLLQLNIDARPPTPRKKTRRVRVGKDYVEKEFKSLVEGHNMDVQAQQVRYVATCCSVDRSQCHPVLLTNHYRGQDYRQQSKKATAAWWPCHNISKKTYLRVREAERAVLVAEFAAREAASAILHGSSAIRAQQVPHAMEGMAMDGTPYQQLEEERRAREAAAQAAKDRFG